MMKFISAANFSLIELSELFTRSFAGYLMPVKMDEHLLAHICNTSFVDIDRSIVAEIEGEPSGIYLFGVRGLLCRCAAMGVIKTQRGRGIGSQLMMEAVKRARVEGFKSIALEVFTENNPAIALYKNSGFKIIRKLVGFEHEAIETADGDSKALKEVDTREIALKCTEECDVNLPWHCTPEYLAALSPPSSAYSFQGKTYAVVTPRAGNLMLLNAVITPEQFRQKGYGGKILDYLLNLYSGKRWMVLPVLPEGLMDGFFLKSGFARMAQSQYEMSLKL